MNAIRTICLLGAAVLSSCGYHAGSMRNPRMNDCKTFCVNMFENRSFYPMAGMQMTNALTEALQSEGTYRMASRETSDITVSGRVIGVTASPLRMRLLDTYVSDEVTLMLKVAYTVTENKTGKVLMHGEVQQDATSANQEGNVQSSRDDAVSWATRRAADYIVEEMTTP